MSTSPLARSADATRPDCPEPPRAGTGPSLEPRRARAGRGRFETSRGAVVAATWIAILVALGCRGATPPPDSSPGRAASPVPDREESIVVETSTDADFVAELPIDDEPDRGVPDGGGDVPPILAATGTVASYDLPLHDHERVDFWIEYLSSRGREHFTKWLARSTRYVPLFWSILDQHGLPRDLVFLSMVESGFSTSAYSWAHAAGPWQFIRSTARRYGLRIDFWVDDRRDFVKATDAAARYLADLYGMYGDWFLAMAAYNAGPGKVNRAIRRYGTEDFWEISKRRHLRRETKQYVPKILAAAELSKLPHVHGIEDVEYQAPLSWEVVTVTTATSLRAMAEACPFELEEDVLRGLNPALRCGVTPPGETWSIRVPRAVTATCADRLRAAPHEERFVYRYHPVGSNDTLAVVARAHETTVEAILAFNRIEPDQFFDFEEIVVPVPRAEAHAVPIRKPPQLAFRPPGYGPTSLKLVRYRVRSGDSLWRIANRFHVSISDLTKWNGLRRRSTLPIGRRLRIYLGGRAARAVAEQRARSSRSRRTVASSRPKRAIPVEGRHTVAAGESPWLIADRYGLSVADILAANDLRPNDVIQPGQVLVLPKTRRARDRTEPAAASSRGAGGRHVVKAGESYWSIAHDHQTTVARLRAKNGLSAGDVLQPGQVLAIPAVGVEPKTRPTGAGARADSRSDRHVVRPGESLWSIATQHGISVDRLCEINELEPSAVIQPGEALRVTP